MLNTPGALLLFRAALGTDFVSVGDEERPEMAESTLVKSDVSADIVYKRIDCCVKEAFKDCRYSVSARCDGLKRLCEVKGSDLRSVTVRVLRNDDWFWWSTLICLQCRQQQEEEINSGNVSEAEGKQARAAMLGATPPSLGGVTCHSYLLTLRTGCVLLGHS